ncbi:hypothetical protein K3152_13855 [Qipengyuania sp. 1NDH17]|uniref:DUF1499 domain-containing protein n=1 Tax=Qipengyuania polymorpha TaxID=2867234 RepID=A0ABS7J0I1_9SPHN|nr:hypothetical protein [Qipengyuania polymorpha]MBX7459333.1 hypothetical protein [Qipengyuania polymorpha]
MKLFVVLVAVVLTALMVLRHRSNTAHPEGADGDFVNVPGDQFALMVRGWSRAELADIFARFAAIYNVGEPQIVETTARTYRLDWPDGLPEAQIWFAVNYVHYPFDFDLTGRTIIAAAKVMAGHLSGIPGDRSAILYIPENDTDHDRVHATDDSGDHYVGDFGDSQFRQTSEARKPREVDSLFA